MKDILRFRTGLLFALTTVLYGFGMGGLFGAREDVLKAGIHDRATAVVETVYGGDTEKLKQVTTKAWSYYKRSHMHAGGIGTTALVLILLMAALSTCSLPARQVTSIDLGAGSLGYSIFWLMAGMRAPGLGSTDAAKESLEWLAMPSAGLCILGVLAVLVFVATAKTSATK